MSEFEKALLAAIAAPRAADGKFNAFSVGSSFIDLIKNVLSKAGIGALTREQFLAIVANAFDLFTASMPIPAMLKPMMKAMVLMIAGRIWDKRNATQSI